ncbi:MAG: response regulator [Pyrinomonadaceae bacterium]
MGRHKLFLVDDSVAIQKVVQLTFADEDFEVEVASDGAEALRKLEAYRPDVILLDVTMPGLSGYEVCRRIRQDASYKQTPIILLVGSFEPFDEREARRSGADDVLTKPFQSIREMVNKIGALLTGRSRAEDEESRQSASLKSATRERPLVIDARPVEPSSSSAAAKVDAAVMANPIAQANLGRNCTIIMCHLLLLLLLRSPRTF